MRAGMEGGRYKPLTDAEMLKIHHAALDVLEQIGMADAIPSGIEVMTKAGAKLNDNGRLIVPARARRGDAGQVRRGTSRCYGQDPRHDHGALRARTSISAPRVPRVHMVDPLTGDYRDSTTKDLFDIARIVDTLDHIHFFQRSVVCRELPDPFEMDFNTCYASGYAAPPSMWARAGSTCRPSEANPSRCCT